MPKQCYARVCRFTLAGVFVLLLAACSSSNQGASTPAAEETTVASTTPSPRAATLNPSATPGPPGTASTVSPPGSILGLPTTAPAGTPAAAGPPLSQEQLNQAALGTTDLPPGFAVTGSGPGGPDLGRDVLASYQEEFQQRDVTSTQSLQQTIIIVDLLGQYKDAGSARGALQATDLKTLNQLLGGVNLTVEAASIQPIADDSTAFHFTGDTSGVSLGGYLVVFRRGSVESLIITASTKGSESLPQTVDLAQKQAQKLQAAH